MPGFPSDDIDFPARRMAFAKKKKKKKKALFEQPPQRKSFDSQSDTRVHGE
jgi:hypothetical protein